MQSFLCHLWVFFHQGENGTYYAPIIERLKNPLPDPTYKIHTDTVKFYFEKKVKKEDNYNAG